MNSGCKAHKEEPLKTAQLWAPTQLHSSVQTQAEAPPPGLPGNAIHGTRPSEFYSQETDALLLVKFGLEHIWCVCVCVFTKPTHLVIKCLGNTLSPMSRCDGGRKKPGGRVRPLVTTVQPFKLSGPWRGCGTQTTAVQFPPTTPEITSRMCALLELPEAWGRQREAGKGVGPGQVGADPPGPSTASETLEVRGHCTDAPSRVGRNQSLQLLFYLKSSPYTEQL